MLSRTRSSASPRARSLRARVNRRFHCRHNTQRSRRRSQPSSSTNTPPVCGELEVIDPAPQQPVEPLNGVAQRLAAPCAQQFTYSLPQPLHALLGNPQATVALRGDAEPQELPFPGPRHRALVCVDSQVQGILEEHPDPAHHSLTRRATAQVNVAVISVAAERETSSLKLPVQIVQQDVGQQRRQRPALRRAFRSPLHHSRSPSFRLPGTGGSASARVHR